MTMLTNMEIDTLVHEDVLGFCVHEWETKPGNPSAFDGEWIHTCDKCSSERVTSGSSLPPALGFAPPYSSDIAVAWSVLQYWVEQGFGVRVDQPFENGRWRAEVFSKSRAPYSSPIFGKGATAPEAICDAALRKVGVVVDSIVQEEDGS